MSYLVDTAIRKVTDPANNTRFGLDRLYGLDEYIPPHLLSACFPDMQYYLKTSNCKFGATCKYHHPRDKAGSTGRVQLNVLGLPLRPVSIPFSPSTALHASTVLALIFHTHTPLPLLPGMASLHSVEYLSGVDEKQPRLCYMLACLPDQCVDVRQLMCRPRICRTKRSVHIICGLGSASTVSHASSITHSQQC